MIYLLTRHMCCLCFQSFNSIQQLLHRLSFVVSLLGGLVSACLNVLAGLEVLNPPAS